MFDYILPPNVQIYCLSCFKMAANKTPGKMQKVQNVNCKIDCDVYCPGFKVIQWLPLSIIPTGKSFHQEIWDISRLFTHISLLFRALGSESHSFCLLGVGKSGKGHYNGPIMVIASLDVFNQQSILSDGQHTAYSTYQSLSVFLAAV